MIYTFRVSDIRIPISFPDSSLRFASSIDLHQHQLFWDLESPLYARKFEHSTSKRNFIYRRLSQLVAVLVQLWHPTVNFAECFLVLFVIGNLVSPVYPPTATAVLCKDYPNRDTSTYLLLSRSGRICYSLFGMSRMAFRHQRRLRLENGI